MTQTTSTPTETTSADGDVSGVVETMLKVRANQQAGHPFSGLLAAEGPQAPETQTLPPPTVAEISYSLSAESALIQQRPAELATAVPPPGLTERGWSPEVTARHPALLAATMAELAASGEVTPEDPIDPTDPDALAAAQRALGFADVIANNLRVAAAELNATRLGQGLQAAMNASPAVQAAVAAAVEKAQLAAGAGGESGPAVTTAAAAPKPTTTSSRTSSSTSGSTSTS